MSFSSPSAASTISQIESFAQPGKLDYSLLSSGQDMLKIDDLQVAEVSRQRARSLSQHRLSGACAGRDRHLLATAV